MKYKISVTQKHIDDAKAGILYSKDEATCCPIALALHEQVSKGTYVLKRRYEWRKKKFISFKDEKNKNGCVNNKFSVAEDIRIGSVYMPSQTISHTKQTKDFVIAFDNGKEVKPFEFEIEINVK